MENFYIQNTKLQVTVCYKRYIFKIRVMSYHCGLQMGRKILWYWTVTKWVRWLVDPFAFLEGCQSFLTQAISYPGHFVPTLVISYLLFGHFVPSNNHFVPRSFRTHFGHFVPRSSGYEMTICWSFRTQVISYPFYISYPFRSFRTQQRWMGGLTKGRTDGQACFDWNNKLTS